MLRVEIVQDPRRFHDLGFAWQELWGRAEAGQFQRFDWISAWWRAAGQADGHRLHVALAWQGSELVAVAPLIIRRHRGMRVLEWAAKDCSDYCDVILAPGHDKMELLALLWGHVSSTGQFDIAYLSHVHPMANTHSFAVVDRKRAVKLRASHRTTVSSFIHLREWAKGQAWFHSLGRNARKTHLRGWRILEATGKVAFRLVEGEEDIRRSLDQLCALKQSWLTERQLSTPVLRDDAALLRELVWTLARAGRLRLFVLECDGKIVAASINILENDCLLAFIAAYDPAFERASPGMILMVEYIRWSIDNGLAKVDFLCGDEGYKERFAVTRVELASFTGSRTLAGWVVLQAESWAASKKRREPQAVLPGSAELAQ